MCRVGALLKSAALARVYSSAVERLTADQQVPGSNPGAPCPNVGWRDFKLANEHTR